MALNTPLIQRLFKGDLSIIFYISLFKLLLHLSVNAAGGYGLFRDEYYYLACADNLAFGYVDQPPFSVWILSIVTSIIGDSLFAIRLVPALCGAATVFLTGLIARQLGGQKIAVAIACFYSMTLIGGAMFGFYSMNAFEFVFWALTAWLIIELVKNAQPKHWIALGLVLGFGLMNKIGMLFLGAGIFVGMVATPQRKWFTTPWPYAAGVIAVLLFLPYVVWNIQNDLAHLEFIEKASSEKYSSLSPMKFINGQILINNPISIVVWLPGAIALFAFKELKPYRILGWMFIIPLLILLVNKTSKAEYLAPAYTILWAAGAVWWEQVMQRYRYTRIAFGVVSLIWLGVAGMLLPVVIPILPVEKYISYSETIGFKPESSEGKELSELPQFYADMFGWEKKAKSVSQAFHALSAEDQKKCAIFSNNYGRCASIDYFSEKYGLPKTIGNHNNYWIWGPRGYTGEVMIILGGSLEGHQEKFETVEQVQVSDCEYCMPYEDNVGVFVCRNPVTSLQAYWGKLKHYN